MDKELAKKCIRTYSSGRIGSTKTSSKANQMETNTTSEVTREPLKTKRAVELLLSGNLKKKVCRYCLNITSPLSELDQIMQIFNKGTLYKVTIRDMIASFHPYKVIDDPNIPNKICEKCLNRTLSSYLFTQQCEQSERALRNCLDDISEKLEKLDPLERPKKRGRQKQNPNFNVIYTEHNKVIDYAQPIINIINTDTVRISEENPEINNLECPKCWQVLPNMELLLNHEKIHPSSMWYSCRLCGKSFVKHNQLKRHIKSTHARGKELALQNNKSTDFRCFDCGANNVNYNSHLLHIEKHKFKMVLEHLVERNMDKLCTVCLKKDVSMVNLENMVCLHGGFPGLNGDRSLYNILGSILPDPKYKYQELLVPNKANITKIVKRNNNNVGELQKTPISNDETEKSDISKTFAISYPEILSLDKLNCKNVYLFTFSEPNKHTDIEIDLVLNDNSSAPSNFEKENTNDKCIINIGEEPIEIDNDKQAVSKRCNENNSKYTEELPKKTNALTNKFTVTNYEYVSDNKTFNNELNKIVIKEPVMEDNKLCKICWIFKKALCEKCTKNKNTEKININKGIANTTENCKLCWIFKNTDKCDYCKKSNMINDGVTAINKSIRLSENDNNTDLLKIEYEEFNPNINKPINSCQNVSDKTNIQTRKRKINEAVTENKKSKWLCNVCLTNNSIDRQTCFCCEANKFNGEKIKINIGLNKSFNISSETISDTDKREVNSLEQEINIDKGLMINSLLKDSITSNNDVKSTQIMETEVSNSDNINVNEIAKEKNTDRQEFMDIDTEEENISDINDIPNFDSTNFTLSPILNFGTTSASYQFNIGSGFSEVKKKKIRRNPLRRMATVLHK